MALSLPGGWKQGQSHEVQVTFCDCRYPSAKGKKVSMKSWFRLSDVKERLSPLLSIPSPRLRLFFRGQELKNTMTLDQVLGSSTNSTKPLSENILWFSISKLNPGSTKSQVSVIHFYDGMNGGQQQHRDMLSRKLLKVLHQVQQGFTLGYAPELAMDGTGGTYFLRNAKQRIVGVFKPQDEEPFAPSNPRGFTGSSLGQSGFRSGVLSGEACVREVGAYLLDRDHFAHIPATCFVEARHPGFHYRSGQDQHKLKLGSLQEFVVHDDVASDLSPSVFSVDEVHRLAILDIRLVNTDRNDANILIRKKKALRSSTSSSHPRKNTPGQQPTVSRLQRATRKAIDNESCGKDHPHHHHEDDTHKDKRQKDIRPVTYELIPIDHGYCLPDQMEIAWCDWCWYNWPQLREPLSDTSRAYIAALDIESDAAVLRDELEIRPACILNMKIAGRVLQTGVIEYNWSLYGIARLLCREELDSLSIVEHMIDQARVNYQSSDTASSSRSLSAPLSIDTSLCVFPPGSPMMKSSNGTSSPPGFWASWHPFSSSASSSPILRFSPPRSPEPFSLHHENDIHEVENDIRQAIEHLRLSTTGMEPTTRQKASCVDKEPMNAEQERAFLNSFQQILEHHLSQSTVL